MSYFHPWARCDMRFESIYYFGRNTAAKSQLLEKSLLSISNSLFLCSYALQVILIEFLPKIPIFRPD